MSFSNFNLRPELMKAIEAMNFHEPTPVQRETIPLGLAGHDILASAQTGTGKTLGFMLPLLNRLLSSPKPGLRALVLLPTRELAAQVQSVARECSRFTHLKPPALVIGGESFHLQERALKVGAPFVIATPGRLLDHMDQRTLHLRDVEVLVLDEADRMLDMGFAPAIREILRHVPAERQTMLFSATLPREIQQLTHVALKNPASVHMAPEGTPASTVNQVLYPVRPEQKNDLLLALLKSTEIRSVLIFCRTKHRADRVGRLLSVNDFSSTVMHADRTQAQRNAALEGFKSGRYKILVATDIAARGLDIKGVSHVINFDVPTHHEDFVHRIGRTGRALEVGDAITLAAPDEEKFVAAIERFINAKLPRAFQPDFPYMRLPVSLPPKPFSDRFGGGRRGIRWGRASKIQRK